MFGVPKQKKRRKTGLPGAFKLTICITGLSIVFTNKYPSSATVDNIMSVYFVSAIIGNSNLNVSWSIISRPYKTWPLIIARSAVTVMISAGGI